MKTYKVTIYWSTYGNKTVRYFNNERLMYNFIARSKKRDENCASIIDVIGRID